MWFATIVLAFFLGMTTKRLALAAFLSPIGALIAAGGFSVDWMGRQGEPPADALLMAAAPGLIAVILGSRLRAAASRMRANSAEGERDRIARGESKTAAAARGEALTLTQVGAFFAVVLGLAALIVVAR